MRLLEYKRRGAAEICKDHCITKLQGENKNVYTTPFS